MSNARFSILQAVAVKDKRISDSQFRTLAALGMYANQEGWCWPSLKKLGTDLGKSFQAVGRDTVALRKLGYLEARGRYDEKTGARHSNLYRLRFDIGPIQLDVEAPSPSDVEAPSPSDVELNAPLNDPRGNSEKAKTEKRGDLVDMYIDMSRSPGIKKAIRIDALESIINYRLGVTPTRKGWKPFLEFVDNQQLKEGRMLNQFLDWLIATPKFDVSFWGPDRMRENWDRAFKSMVRVTQSEDGTFYG